MADSDLFIGVDFGTESVRAALFDDAGACHGEAVVAYPRFGYGAYTDPANHCYRQHPLDYVESFDAAIINLLKPHSEKVRQSIKAIGVATTGSTPGPVDAAGLPLALHDRFAEDPDAMFALWKDHAAIGEAEEITAAARNWPQGDYTRYCGGAYSAEWFWAKLLRVVRRKPEIAAAASWVEHCDWIVGYLTGVSNSRDFPRSRCAAGHKAMWREEWGGLPDKPFWMSIDSKLEGVCSRLYDGTGTADQAAGKLAPALAEKYGLSAEVVIAGGALDAHMSAVGAGIQPGALVKVVGTSTCDMAVCDPEFLRSAGGEEKVVSGICGQADSSILPGFVGLEAGQSAFGDIFDWFGRLIGWRGAGKNNDAILSALSAAAEALPPVVDGPVALDWFNGRRSPDVDLTREAAVAGLSLGVDAPRFYRTLVESAAFGSRAILERFTREGVPIEEVIAVGGIANKSPLVMQVMSDVLGRPIHVAAAPQACALGCAMAAAVASGRFPDLGGAQEAMGGGFRKSFEPHKNGRAAYDVLYARYAQLAAQVSG
ncbi:ribulokinase [Marinicaulis aureus]|uniref:Ribulokinase n=1 Tax=Hyphococcus aureus TaxID=2666033 RepID=A0ABW1KU96_9PROT